MRPRSVTAEEVVWGCDWNHGKGSFAPASMADQADREWTVRSLRRATAPIQGLLRCLPTEASGIETPSDRFPTMGENQALDGALELERIGTGHYSLRGIGLHGLLAKLRREMS